MKKIYLVSVLPLLLITSCNNKTQKEYFKLWNDCASIKLLKEFVEDVTNKDSKNYIPAEDRIATFDMDGTLCCETDPGYFGSAEDVGQVIRCIVTIHCCFITHR